MWSVPQDLKGDLKTCTAEGNCQKLSLSAFLVRANLCFLIFGKKIVLWFDHKLLLAYFMLLRALLRQLPRK